MEAFPSMSIAWDDTKSHHIAVLTDRKAGRLYLFCADCDAEQAGPISKAMLVRANVLSDPEAQLVMWIDADE